MADKYWHSPQCAHEGCTERALYTFSSRRAEQTTIEFLRRIGGWRCERHTHPDEVLSSAAPVREVALVSRETDHGRFFAPEGQTKGGNGFVYGPGFRAFAEDFPPGTRLVVTARVEIPSQNDN